VQRDGVLEAGAQAAERVVDGLRRELAGLDQLDHPRGEITDGLDVDRRQAHQAEERLQPPLAGRAVAVARDLGGTMVAPQPGVEMLGEGLSGARSSPRLARTCIRARGTSPPRSGW